MSDRNSGDLVGAILEEALKSKHGASAKEAGPNAACNTPCTDLVQSDQQKRSPANSASSATLKSPTDGAADKGCPTGSRGCTAQAIISQDGGVSAEPRKTGSPTKEQDQAKPRERDLSSRKRSHDNNKDGRAHKQNHQGSSKHHERSRTHSSSSKSDNTRDCDEVKSDIKSLKTQMGSISAMLEKLAPVVGALKEAYDDSRRESPATVSDDDEPALSDGEDSDTWEDQPQAKRSRLSEMDNQNSARAEDPESQGLDCWNELYAAVSNEEARAPDIHDKMAKLMDTVLHTGMPKKLLDEKAKEYNPPGNCTYMTQIKCNQKLWGSLRPVTRYNDKAMQNWQSLLFSGITPFLQVADACTKHIEGDGVMPGPVDMLKRLSDGITLLAGLAFEISMHRRSLIKPDINEQYKALASPLNPVTKQLFGDNLDQNVKDIEEAMKIANKTKKANTFQNNNYKQKHKGAGSSYGIKGNKPFLAGRNHRMNQAYRRPKQPTAGWPGRKPQKKARY